MQHESLDDLIQRCTASFQAEFGRDPQKLAYAPGRVNLIGDHTDYCDGFVMPAALDAGCVCAIAPADGTLSARADDLNESASVTAQGSINPDTTQSSPHWLRYIAGTFEAMRDATGADASGAKIAVASSIPPGSGLSSSASLEVSVATALESLWETPIEKIAKAKACQRAEHEYANVPCGLMDQLASIFGVAKHALRIDCASNEVVATPLPDQNQAVFAILETAVSHSNASGAYQARRAACESAASKMGGATLRDVQGKPLPESLTAEERDAATHVMSENDRVRAFAEALQAGDLAGAGKAMNESHDSLSNTYRVSCDELDTLAALTREASGIHGARMTGGGFGGWVVALADPRDVESRLEEIMSRYSSATGQRGRTLVVRAGDGARPLD